MNKRIFIRHIFLVFISITLLALFGSCKASSQGTHRAPRYTHQKTKQAHWNSTTSRTTTYYIRKHNTRKSKNH